MTCTGCVAYVRSKLESSEFISSVTVRLDPPEAEIEFTKPLPTSILQGIIEKNGKYIIQELPQPSMELDDGLLEESISTFKPLILIIAFISGASLLTQFPFDDFSLMLWMRHFMAGFFIVFSFFKLLNLSGFAMSYKMYDIVAAKWNFWSYLYPFVELTLGILYLIDIYPLYTNLATVIVLGVSSIGVIKSNLDKSSIKCACLGDVFNLPMSTVTIIEDLSMVLMAVLMLVFS